MLVSLPFSTVETLSRMTVSHETVSQFVTSGKMNLAVPSAGAAQSAGDTDVRKTTLSCSQSQHPVGQENAEE